jgi:hypothetical protein
MRRFFLTLLVLAATGACGGGGGSVPTARADTDVPAAPSAPAAPVAPAVPAPPPAPIAPAATCDNTFAPTDAIQAIGGTAATDLWAVGLPGVVLHYDGTSWSKTCLADPVPLAAVWSASPADAWAVGGQAIYRFGAGAWTRVPVAFPVNGTFVAVWGSAANDVWIVAEDVTVHFDGVAFTTQTLADMRSLGFPFGAFREVWGTSATDVWLVADRGTLHWDGVAWWGSLAAPERDVLSSVWAASVGEAWTVGVSLDGGGTAWHWQGQGWREDPWKGGAPFFASVRGTATGDVFFQTPDNLYERRGTAVRALAPPAPPTGAPHVLAANDLWLPDAIGVARWDGARWTRSYAVPR